MPNTVVKLINAESTWLEAAREDRKLLIKRETHPCKWVRFSVQKREKLGVRSEELGAVDAAHGIHSIKRLRREGWCPSVSKRGIYKKWPPIWRFTRNNKKASIRMLYHVFYFPSLKYGHFLPPYIISSDFVSNPEPSLSGNISQVSTSGTRSRRRQRHLAQGAVNGLPIQTSCACSSHFFSHAFRFSSLHVERIISSFSM